MIARRRLPNRRPSVTISLDHDGREYEITLGYDPSEIAIKEIFCTDKKSGSAMDFLIADQCVALSLLMQYGIPISDLTRSLGRIAVDMDDPASLTRPASIFGVLTELLAFEIGDEK